MNKKIISSMLLLTSMLVTGCEIKKPTYEVETSVDLNKKPKLKVIYPNSGMQDSQFKNSHTTRMYEQITGYQVDYEQILAMDIDPTITNILVNKEEYNLMKLPTSTYQALVQGDNFVDLTEILEKYGPNLLKTIPENVWETAKYNGKIYGVPDAAFSSMADFAMIWNKRHLESVGITKLPDTIGEVMNAFEKLSAKYSSSSEYNVFAMQGSQAYIDSLAPAWDLQQNYYVNEQGEVSHIMYHPNYESYMKFLNKLVQKKYVSAAWQGYTSPQIMSNFSKGNLSCAYIPYWNLKTLYDLMAATSQYNNTDEARAATGWVLRVKGDGAEGSSIQEVAKFNGSIGAGYYSAIPAHMAKNAAYVIDWMDKRITDEAYTKFYLGDENVHYTVSNAEDKDAVKTSIDGVEKYIKLTDKYEQEILSNSMYANGGNAKIGIAYWPLRESIYGSWNVLTSLDEPGCMKIVMSLTGYIPKWSEIDMASLSWVITLEQQMSKSDDDKYFQKCIDKLRTQWKTKYWTDEVNTNVQNWYKNRQGK